MKLKYYAVCITAFLFNLVNAQVNYVTLHEDCNYGGRRFFLEPGTYRSYQMKVDNDKLSSLQIPSGMKVTIYEHDDFEGRSQTFTSNIACLEAQWNDMASSIVVENANYQPGYNNNDYVVFFSDCYSRGFSRTLKPGTYTGNDLGNLKSNISSFVIYGNLRIRVYTNNDIASGYYQTFDASESCLSSNYNDKIRSLVVEYKPGGGTPGGGGITGRFVSFYSDCNYGGNSMRLLPGYYQGEKLGMFRNDISSIEVPSGLRVKAFTNETLSGYSTTISENNYCLSSSLNNRIASFIIEETGFNNNYPPSGNAVIIYADGDYRGQSATILPGNYSTMAQVDFPDNALSSLTVPAGFRVVLYEFENFQGKSYTITQSKPGFLISGWNDKTSSIAVFRDR
jgi:hypothetical protein